MERHADRVEPDLLVGLDDVAGGLRPLEPVVAGADEEPGPGAGRTDAERKCAAGHRTQTE
jgi:hypothetical protein